MSFNTNEPTGQFPRTRIFHIGIEERNNYVDFAIAQWHHLDWRHAGFGALQAYLSEGESSELRIHVWHPSLVRPGIAESGLCHDHRFDMRSVVLAGQIVQVEADARPNPSGAWQTSRVVHAREAMTRVGSYHMDPEPDGGYWDRSFQTFYVPAGAGYGFPRFAFHETRCHQPTVTLVRKSGQLAARARILHPRGVPVVNAFEHPQTVEQFSGALADGLAALRNVAP